MHALAGIAADPSNAQSVAMRALCTCRRNIEPMQNRCSLLQDTLMFDPVQAPSLRHIFELVNAAVLEADSRLRHQTLDGAGDQDFAGTRFRGDARPM